MELILGDCREKLKELEDNSIDAIVTDPPYGLSFMGKKWDYDVPSVDIWKECLRVLKPGGYLLAFAGTRTQHRMAVNIEDAGFEIRDMIAWVYGSGFPKSLNIGKAVDKLQGNEREFIGYKKLNPRDKKVYTPNTETSFVSDTKGVNTKGLKGQENTKGTSEWEGWGTALKPAVESITVALKPFEEKTFAPNLSPIIMSRKPLGEKTVAENCLKWGVGGINIDGCRVEAPKGDKFGGGGLNSPVNGFMGNTDNTYKKGTGFRDDTHLGRFPANLIHDGSEEVVGLFPQTKSGAMNSMAKGSQYNTYGKMYKRRVVNQPSEGSASRFFYCAKASKRERNRGCENMEEKFAPKGNNEGRDMGNPKNHLGGMQSSRMQNFHPTVKPVALMEYLVKLVSREGQVVLDPFMGSGTTGMACKKLDREFIGIEMMPEYMEIARARIEGTKKEEQLRLDKE